MATKRRQRIDLSGKRFGRLVVTKYAGQRDTRHRDWWCKCDCGRRHLARQNDLKGGKTQSCGCLRREMVADKNRTHDLCGTREYRIWGAMLTRCTNPNAISYEQYGGRGITICDRWQFAFEFFLADMGPCPSSRHSIERLDNAGPYEARNCIWATRKIQSRNTRRNIWITWKGKRMVLTDALQASKGTYYRFCRLRRSGFDPQQAFDQMISALRNHTIA